MMRQTLNTHAEIPPLPYRVGEYDERAWGWYEVTAIGGAGDQAFCEKTIFINPAARCLYSATPTARKYGR